MLTKYSTSVDAAVEIQLQATHDLHKFRYTYISLIIICILVFISFGMAFQRFTNQRTRNLESIQEANEKLREAELCYRTIADYTYDWEYWIKPDGTLRYCSPSCERITGYSVDQFMNHTGLMDEIVLPEDIHIWDKHHHDITEKRNLREIWFRIRHQDGNIIWIEHACRPVIDEQGTFQGYRTSNRDITRRKQAEESIKEQARLLDMIFEHTLDSIVLLDKDYNFIRVSKTYAKADQRDSSEFPGHNHFEFYPSDFKDEADEAKKGKYIYRKSARPFIYPYHPERGTTYWNLGLVPILDQEGEIELFLFTLKDVTKQVQTEKKLIKARDELENRVKERTSELMELNNKMKQEINERKKLQAQLIRSERLAAAGQLAASVAHEINSPLQGISSIIALLRESYEKDNEQSEYIELIEEGFHRIKDTVKNLLDLNRPTMEIKQVLNINKIIWKTVSLLQVHLKKNNVKLKLELSPKLPGTTGSPQMLGHVFMNLINNALEAIIEKQDPENDRKITINTRVCYGNIVIKVQDTGTGIPEHDIESLFDPFFTTKSPKGMGIGLSTCMDIVKDHKGSMVPENSHPGGSIFTILLPIC
ncbi:PAS domain S-box protein [Desulfobacterales bacterium HSG17]|nr:PAS domain S-box protein [Desulfobacterales bacterium HSG17]